MNTETKAVPTGAVSLYFTTCPDWGRGGRYIYNPVTGRRERVVEDQDGAAGQHVAAAVADAGTPTPATKEKKRG